MIATSGPLFRRQAACESACAYVFLGGTRRLIEGALGVHQFYQNTPTENVSQSTTVEQTQYTTSEVIGILNDFDTPPFVYEKMFGTTGMHYFRDDRKAELARNSDDAAFQRLIEEVRDFVAATPAAVARQSQESPSRPEADPEPDPVPQPVPTVEARPSAPDILAPAAPLVQFQHTDFFGMDLSTGGIRDVSLQSCEKICRNDPACAAYSYVTATRWCWPKSAVENVSIAPGTISGLMDSARVNPEVLRRPFREATGIDIVGRDLLPRGLRNTPLHACRRACQADPDCRAFSWVAEKNWCFPKHGSGSYRVAPGIISGERMSTATPAQSVAPLTAAIDFVTAQYQIWSGDNAGALAGIASTYAPQVAFYGNDWSRDRVMAEKRAFARRWPKRSYAFRPDVSASHCQNTGVCRILGEVDWIAHSPERNTTSQGTSTLIVTLKTVNQSFEILREEGKVIARH